MSAAFSAREARRRFALALLAAAIASWAPSADACSVCLSATEETREAYYLTTVLLMSLPFALLGTLFYWLRKAAGRRGDAQKPSS
jgi:hypothetical protein